MKPSFEPLLPLLVLGAALAAQAPDFESSSRTYDTSLPQDTRMPRAMAQADLDGDGDLDVAVSNGANIPGLSVLRNRGNGSFEPPDVYSTGGRFWDDLDDLTVADFDRDGDPDVAISNFGNVGTGAKVVLFRNRGDGTFSPFVTFPTGAGPAGIAALDYDGDGWTDLATADYGRIGQGSTVSLLRNDGTGSFLPPVAIEVGASPLRLAPGDVDGDGDPDLVVARESHAVVVLRNTGGTFAATTVPVLPNQWAGTGWAAVELADLDRDGDLDVVYTNNKTGFGAGNGSGAIAVLYNDGSGGLGEPLALRTLPETQGGVDLAVADWNGDGWLDIASAHAFDGEWLMFESNGSGDFLPPRKMATGSDYANDVDAADVTGDGRPDVLVLERHSLGVAVYPNPVAGGIRDPEFFALVSSAPLVGNALDAADVDGDGDRDVGASWSAVASNSGGVTLALNDGAGRFSNRLVLNTPTKARALQLRDLNGDGRPDIVWADDFIPYQWHVRLNQGGLAFAETRTFNGLGCAIADLEAFDFDNDGDLDVAISHDRVCGSGNGHPVFLARNDGSANFQALAPHITSTFASFVTSADVDADGNADLLTNSGFNGIEISLGNGDGTFRAPILAFTEWGPKSIAAGDWDGDGNLDLATSNLGASKGETSISVLQGFGDGGFAPPENYPGAYDPNLANAGRIRAGDADGDGDLDLMVAHWASRDVSLYRGRGDGAFEPQIRYGAGAPVFDLLLDDLTGDGVADLGVGISPGLSLSFFPALTVLPGTAGTTWRDVGGGLAGSAGVPMLFAATPFVGGTTLRFDVTNAPAAAAGAFVLGLAPVNASLFGGTLVPRPDFVTALTTGANGASTLPLPVPAGLPYGLEVWVQSWLVDRGAPAGFAATNALRGTHY